MILTGKVREEILNSLNLPAGILRLSKGQVPHELMEDDIRKLTYSYDFPDCSPDGITVCPIWEGHSTITGFAVEKGCYIRYEIESPNSYELFTSSVNSVITNLLVWYWTEEEAEEKDLRAIALGLSYPHIDILLRELPIANEELSESQDEWEKRFRESHP